MAYNTPSCSKWSKEATRRTLSPSSSSQSTSSPSSSSSPSSTALTDGKSVRKKRSLPHEVYTCSTKLNRLQAQPTNYSSFPQFGNPHYGNVMMLFSRTGWHLRIDPNGKVSGVQADTSPYVIFEVLSAGYPGHVFLRNRATKLYVAFNKKGRLYGERRNDLEETIWLEEMLGYYNTYLSKGYAHLGWYLALKKSGKAKKGSKTEWGQKAIQFLPRRVRT